MGLEPLAYVRHQTGLLTEFHTKILKTEIFEQFGANKHLVICFLMQGEVCKDPKDCKLPE